MAVVVVVVVVMVLKVVLVLVLVLVVLVVVVMVVVLVLVLVVLVVLWSPTFKLNGPLRIAILVHSEHDREPRHHGSSQDWPEDSGAG